MITGSDEMDAYMLDHISDSDDEPPEELEIDEDEAYEASRQIEIEEDAKRRNSQRLKPRSPRHRALDGSAEVVERADCTCFSAQTGGLI